LKKKLERTSYISVRIKVGAKKKKKKKKLKEKTSSLWESSLHWVVPDLSPGIEIKIKIRVIMSFNHNGQKNSH
jgi:hypothetical protein